MSSDNQNSRGCWNSRLGFILAAAGSAIGLGNIWRFPYKVGENGGAAFLILYLVCVVLLGLPIMLAELSLGKFTRRNPVGAFQAIKPGGNWKIVGFMGVATGVGILSYYAVMAGYSLGYIVKIICCDGRTFESFAANPAYSILLFVIFTILTALVVRGGIKNGIERWAKILMPILLGLLVILIIRSVTLEGAGEGLAFYFRPDFSKVTGKTLLDALGQAFFSLSLGMGAMITYGSYLPEDASIFSSGCSVALFDTLIAILAGLLIFPALFSAGLQPDEGPSLVFKVLPRIFSSIPAGNIVGAAFFILLSIAALTSTISLLEVATAYFVDEKHWLRKKAVWVISGMVLVLGLPSALSQGIVPWLEDLPIIHTSFLGMMDWIFGNLMLEVGALLLAIFVVHVWKTNNVIGIITGGRPGLKMIEKPFRFLMAFFCPLIIIILLIFLIF
ncbi:MAG: sodium-dependent transporter [Candidatus Latescibacteria bacterium]|nr:sodium-dependent transporter [bacterium]MBD3425329.1 sodium-dependent transporter [Candidatus Latescibacterota bacterium]